MTEDKPNDFGNLIQSDEVFVDYLNFFLKLKIFPKKIQFDRTCNSFIEIDLGNDGQAPLSYTQLSLQERTTFNKFLIKWCLENRLPYFLRSKCYREYKLCKKLIEEETGVAGLPESYTTSSAFTHYSLGRPVDITGGIATTDLDKEESASDYAKYGEYHERPKCFSADIIYHKKLARAYSLPVLPPLNAKPESLASDIGSNIFDSVRPSTSVSWLDRSLKNRDTWPSYNQDIPFSDDEEFDVKERGGSMLEFSAAQGEDANDEDILNELRSMSTKLHMSVLELKEDYLASMEKMANFKKFLSKTKGNRLIEFWLHLEEYKNLVVWKSLIPGDERELRNRIVREVENTYKGYLTQDAKGQIKKLKDDTSAAGTFFRKVQRDIIRRLESYWVPRFLVHLEKSQTEHVSRWTESGRESVHSMFPSISFVKSLPLLGNEITETPKDQPFNSLVFFVDQQWRPGKLTENLYSTGNDSALEVDIPFTLDKDAGYPFYSFLNSTVKHTSATQSLEFLIELEGFISLNQNTEDRLKKVVAAWKLYNKYLSSESPSRIDISMNDELKIKKTLLDAKDLNRRLTSSLFSDIAIKAKEKLRTLWELYCEEDLQIFVKTNMDSVRMSAKAKRVPPRNVRLNYETSRWVQRYPGSTESERRRRLYTALSVAEEINASRLSDKSPVLEKPKKKKKKKKKVKFQEDKDANESQGADAKKQETPSLSDLMDNKLITTSFRQYVQNQEGRETLNNLMLLMDINDYGNIPINKTPQRQQQAKFIFTTYFDRTSRRWVELPDETVQGIEDGCPSSTLLNHVSELLQKELNRPFKAFYKLFQSSLMESAQDGAAANVGGKDGKKEHHDHSKHSHLYASKFKKGKRKGSARMQPSKEDRISFINAAKQCTGHMSESMELFRRYLLLQSEGEAFPRLEKDLLFYLEVQKFKALWSHMDEISINRKAEVIIDVFLDSSTPPWIQVDIGSELTAKIIQRAQHSLSNARRVPKDQKDSTIFDEAQATVLKELLLYWTSFNQKYPDEKAKSSMPVSKFEKNRQRRYDEFLEAPNVTDTVLARAHTPGEGKSRHEMMFSFSSGAGWKDAPIDTDSVSSEGSFHRRTFKDYP